MTIKYEFSPQSLRKGMKAHLLHRHLLTTLILPALGGFFILFGLYKTFLEGSDNATFGVVLIALGAFYLVRIRSRTNSAVKNAFKANPNERMITLKITDSVLSFEDGESTGTSPLSSFVDFKICKTGLLLYPQKNIFHWIPDAAVFEGGTWQEFTGLISSEITRKI
jgi:hypothetical protein